MHVKGFYKVEGEMDMKFSKKMSAWIFLLILINSKGFVTAEDYEEMPLTLSSNPYTIKEIDGYDKIIMEGFQTRGLAGAPKLPQKVYDITLPSNARLETVQLEITSVSAQIIIGEYEIAPGPLPVSISVYGVSYDEKKIQNRKDVDIYGKNSFYPLNPVEMLRTYQTRNEKVVRIQFTPLQYNPISRKLQLNKEVHLKILF